MPRPTKRKAAYKKVLRDERGKEMNSILSTQKQANGDGLSDDSLSMNDERKYMLLYRHEIIGT
ncbi:2547_t:CDS:2 [Paraglomus brasilianum]|uniref:2547_t:CDS:1 n=1 Tax=Paraglomus brasilianum TaxID=144538 RepID=A0A9N9CBJ2_9GLOM|nr:2547_t:CDS:2 [Paraglomus brasilianum]